MRNLGRDGVGLKVKLPEGGGLPRVMKANGRELVSN
jgi:hypothetical protein